MAGVTRVARPSNSKDLISPTALNRTIGGKGKIPGAYPRGPALETQTASGAIRGGLQWWQGEASTPGYHRPGIDATREALIDIENRAARRDRAHRARRWHDAMPFDRHKAYLRLPELERIYASRYGMTLPDDDAGRGDLCIAFNHIAYRSGDVLAQMLGWAHRFAPWMPRTEACTLALNIAKHPRRWTAEQLGKALRLTAEERHRLHITTIRAFDMTLAQCRQAGRERWNAKRRTQTRAEYLASSVSRAKPWEREGISRATWYRRAKAGECPRETSPRQHVSQAFKWSRTPVSPRPAAPARPATMVLDWGCFATPAPSWPPSERSAPTVAP
jgi:hypothetical protein